jgi:hypothetical protein
MRAAARKLPAIASPRALDAEDPAAEVNARAAAGLGARTVLICFGVLRRIFAAATPAAGHRRVHTMIAASGTTAALACICELCALPGAVEVARAVSIVPVAPIAITIASAITNRNLATPPAQ